jgi:hypothetical protein
MQLCVRTLIEARTVDLTVFTAPHGGGGDDFQLSHEFLAMMLHASRPTVTVVASTLQKAGLISYTHGHINILDRPGLEAASCECYAAVKARFDQLAL